MRAVRWAVLAVAVLAAFLDRALVTAAGGQASDANATASASSAHNTMPPFLVVNWIIKT